MVIKEDNNINFNNTILFRVLIGFLFVVLGVIVRPVMYVAALYLVIVLLYTKSNEDLICMLFAWMNVATIFKLSREASSLFTYIEIIVLFIFIVRTSRINKRFFCAWAVFTGYLLIGIGSNYTDFIKLSIAPMLIYYFTSNVTQSGIKRLSTYYTLGVFVQCILGLFKDSIPNMTEYIQYRESNVSRTLTGLVREIRFSGLSADPNYFSIFLILSIAMCMVFYTRNEMKNTVFFALLSGLAIMGGLTGSKSFLFDFAVAIILLIIVLNKKHTYNKALGFIAVLLIAIVYLFTANNSPFSLVMKRLNFDNGTDLTTGRMDILIIYLNAFKDNLKLLFFGNGISNGFLNGRSTHNYLLDCIFFCGLVGSAIYLYMMYCAFNLKRSHRDYSSYIPLVLLGVLYLSLSMFFQYELVFQLTAIALFLNMKSGT